MAMEAERMLNGTGWLPEPLSLSDIETTTDAQTGEAEALPDFLAEDDDGQAEAEEEQPQIAAAAE
jgi:ParB family chromosome partitioning protein